MSVTRARGRRTLWALAIALLVTLFIISLSRLDLGRVMFELGRARPLWIVTAIACYLCILPLWALQWWLLSPAAPARTPTTMLGVVAMTSSVLNTTPLLVGEAAAVQFLYTETKLDRAAGLAVLAMDQLFVGVAKVTVLSGAALLLPLPTIMERGIRLLVASVAVLLLALLCGAWLAPLVRRETDPPPSSRLPHLATRAMAGLSPLRSPVRSGGALALALLKKFAELFAILAIQRAFGVELPLPSALLVLAALNVATLLPIVPGNAGVFEAAMVLAYVQLGVPAERSLGMAVVQHLSYFGALAVPGYWWLVRSASRNLTAAP